MFRGSAGVSFELGARKTDNGREASDVDGGGGLRLGAVDEGDGTMGKVRDVFYGVLFNNARTVMCNVGKMTLKKVEFILD